MRPTASHQSFTFLKSLSQSFAPRNSWLPCLNKQQSDLPWLWTMSSVGLGSILTSGKRSRCSLTRLRNRLRWAELLLRWILPLPMAFMVQQRKQSLRHRPSTASVVPAKCQESWAPETHQRNEAALGWSRQREATTGHGMRLHSCDSSLFTNFEQVI